MNRYPKVGRVTSASVQKGTGKTWDQWIRLLHRAGARAWTHQEIVAYLRKRHGLGPWWQQGVTLGYEIAIERRVEGQNQKGRYTVTATKSLAREASVVWKHLLSGEGQAQWLRPLFEVSLKPGAAFETEDGYFGEVRTIQAGRALRLRWQEPRWDAPTTVQVILVKRTGKRCLLAFSHEGFRDTATREKLRARWRHALEQLSAALKLKPSA